MINILAIIFQILLHGLVKECCQNKLIPLNTELQALAIQVSLQFKLTICNIYIPPNTKLILRDLENIIKQLPTPYILCGDFNAHNILWGSDSISTKGRLIETLLDNHGLLLHNDGSYTHFSSATGTFSAIDITLSSPTIGSIITWRVHNDLCSSDHFLIFTSLGYEREVTSRASKWVIQKADWTKFSNSITLQPPDEHYTCHDMLANLTEQILKAAHSSIPRTSTKMTRPPVPRWNDQCQKTIRNRRKCLRFYKKKPNIRKFNCL